MADIYTVYIIYHTILYILQINIYVYYMIYIIYIYVYIFTPIPRKPYFSIEKPKCNPYFMVFFINRLR